MHINREGDVFWFSYKEGKRLPYSDHCFDGQLILIGDKLYDTYYYNDYHKQWYYGEYVRNLSFSEADEKGILTFKCNLNDVEKIEKWETEYYDDEDIFNLCYQHGCCKWYVKRKDAQKSQSKMIQVLTEKIEEHKRKIEWEEDKLNQHQEMLEQVKQGNLDVHI